MKGYLSFLLVFASAFLILTILQSYYAPNEVSFQKAIAAERVYQVEMNSKEAALEAVREGGREGFSIYNQSHFSFICNDPDLGGPLDPLCFRIDEAKIWVKAGAYLYLVKLGQSVSGQSMDVGIFCTSSSSLSDDEARDIARSIREQGSYCPGCGLYQSATANVSVFAKDLIAKGQKDSAGNPVYSKIAGSQCMEIIIPDIQAGIDPDENPELEKISLNGAIVASAYYRDFNVSAVSFIPAGYEVKP